MSMRIFTTTVVLIFTAAIAHAQQTPGPVAPARPSTTTKSDLRPGPKADTPVKQWVWLEKQGLWGYGHRIESGEYQGLWRIDPDTKRPPAVPEPPADPHGFTAMLNRLRATVGLGPVAYDQDLSAWAARNNAAQCHRGLGHHVNPNCLQNSAWNTPDASSTLSTWLNSPGHRENLLSPEITRVGLAHGPGPYWTMNAR